MSAIRRDELYPMLWEVVRKMGSYHSRRDLLVKEILVKHPKITLDELSLQLGVLRGEALILLRSHRLWHYEVEEEVELSRSFTPIYNLGAVGGTFDELHIGHVALLNTAFRLSKNVLIGVTSDEFALSLMKEGKVSPFAERVEELRRTLERYGWLSRAEIVRLDDPYGPLLSDERIGALITGPITLSRAEEAINLRVSRGLQPIALELSPLVLAEDGRPVSSTRIRLGEVDRFGRLKGGRK
ncbi:MAG: pantetheine-phosphate adenylyltransferase [Nitrososphaerota archaeon]|nr:pantetheine-phosphate adenylyltransferase [Candidatus Calditenuaceae archaeon]MDW8073780.1 pantetheine-phosphate adenylyltransferase [Nitrososphaerota archaeon]